MENVILDACRWHVDGDFPRYKQRAFDNFRERYAVLLDFLRAEGLLADPSLGLAVSDWMDFKFRRSHLTEEGFALFKLCFGTWNPAFGQAHTQRHLIQWRRKLARLRGSDQP